MKIDTDNLKGKCAFVSGATGGIGKAIAVTLAKEGCDLFLTSTSSTSLKLTVDACKEYDVRVETCIGDLSNK